MIQISCLYLLNHSQIGLTGSKMKTYQITRFKDYTSCVVDQDADSSYSLEHIIHHSPTGFEFGYNGSGPADLALSILADHFSESAKVKLQLKSPWQDCPHCIDGEYPTTHQLCFTCHGEGSLLIDTKTLKLYQSFKEDWITNLNQNHHSIDSNQIDRWVQVTTRGSLE